MKEIALRRACPAATGLEGTLSNVVAALGQPMNGGGGDFSDDTSEPRDLDT